MQSVQVRSSSSVYAGILLENVLVAPSGGTLEAERPLDLGSGRPQAAGFCSSLLSLPYVQPFLFPHRPEQHAAPNERGNQGNSWPGFAASGPEQLRRQAAAAGRPATTPTWRWDSEEAREAARQGMVPRFGPL